MCCCTQTLFCANTVADQLLQVTRADVRLVDATTRALVQAWQPPAGLQINVASASASQVRPSRAACRRDVAFLTATYVW